MFMFLISLSLQTRIVMGFLFFALVNAYLFLAFLGYALWAILWAIYFTNLSHNIRFTKHIPAAYFCTLSTDFLPGQLL